MKRIVGLLLLTAVITLALAGCGGKETPGALTQPDEILTYDKIDPKKTQLTVSMLGNNANALALKKAFEKDNPDVQVICLDITGGNSGYRPVVDWVTNGVAPDVMFVNPDSFTDDEQTIKYFEDLSADPSIENFEAAALNRVAIDGHVYFLPSPSEVNCMLYNKTLFEKYAWQVPRTFDDFVSLCKRIREDTQGEVQPWNPNAKYDSVLSTALEAFTYEELFGGADNRGWYNEFCEGKATFKGHMEPFYNLIQTLIDEKILLEEHFTYSATTRGIEFDEGKIAMINAPVTLMKDNEYEFAFMPYPTTKGELGYVNDYFSSMVCVPKKERSQTAADAVNRFLKFFGSAEGQRALIGDTLMISNVKDVPSSYADALSGIEQVISQGHKFSRLDFPGAGERIWTFRDSAMSMLKGEKTVAQIIAEIDESPYITSAEADGGAKKIAEVANNFTTLEFSCYIADMYREKAQAEIGLINHLVAYRGNLIKLFKGDILDSYVNAIKPRSFANKSTLVKLSMTGEQILSALNAPVGNGYTTDSVYAFSGLKCEIAPTNELGKKYLSVKLSDGKALENDKLYTVAAWDGTVAPEFITETLETYEGTWEELMTAKLVADKTISPADDGRFALVWN